jgi:hypothetical protein
MEWYSCPGAHAQGVAPPARAVRGRRDSLLTSRHPYHGASPGLAGIRAGGGTGLFSGPGDTPFPRFTATFSENQQPSGTCGRGPPASMPARSARRCFRPEYIVARSSPAGLRPGPGPDAPAIARVYCRQYTGVIRIYDHDCPSLPCGTHTPRRRANVPHIGPEQPGNAPPCGNRTRPGELMILILPR